MAELTTVDIARRLADALEASGMEYAVGGALALGYYATPRATVDVDINIFVPPETGLDALLDLLGSIGFAADHPETLRQTATEEGQFRGRMHGIRVDVFVPAIELYELLNERKRRVELLGKPLYILSAEDLLTLKMIFFRRKDLADAEAILRGWGGIDLARVRNALLESFEEDDPRFIEWDKLVMEVDGS